MTWKDLQPTLPQHAEAYGLDPALAFPAPSQEADASETASNSAASH